jgi:hypothetical protein
MEEGNMFLLKKISLAGLISISLVSQVSANIETKEYIAETDRLEEMKLDETFTKCRKDLAQSVSRFNAWSPQSSIRGARDAGTSKSDALKEKLFGSKKKEVKAKIDDFTASLSSLEAGLRAQFNAIKGKPNQFRGAFASRLTAIPRTCDSKIKAIDDAMK